MTSSDNPEMFLYYFKECRVNECLPASTQEEILYNFRAHQRKVWDASWLIAHCNVSQDMPNSARRKELVEERMQQITAHMRALGLRLSKENRSKLWLGMNNEKYKMKHEK